MEAINQHRVTNRTWQLFAIAVLLTALFIGGAAGYVVRLATAPALTVVHSAAGPAIPASSQASGTSAQDTPCMTLTGTHPGKAC